MNLPNIVMPGEQSIREAVSRINDKLPGFFKNVKEIRVAPGGTGFGFVTNKAGSEGVIFLDFNKIKSNISTRMGGRSKEEFDEALIIAIAEVISHEVGHLDDELKGGEFPAEQKAREVIPKLNSACIIFNKLAKFNLHH